MILCPNCDFILSGSGCQSCGWRQGDPHPAFRKLPPHLGGTFPFRPDAQYPPEPGQEPARVEEVEQILASGALEGATAPIPVDEVPSIPPVPVVSDDPPLLAGHTRCPSCGLGVADADFDDHFLGHMAMNGDAEEDAGE